MNTVSLFEKIDQIIHDLFCVYEQSFVPYFNNFANIAMLLLQYPDYHRGYGMSTFIDAIGQWFRWFIFAIKKRKNNK